MQSNSSCNQNPPTLKVIKCVDLSTALCSLHLLFLLSLPHSSPPPSPAHSAPSLASSCPCHRHRRECLQAFRRRHRRSMTIELCTGTAAQRQTRTEGSLRDAARFRQRRLPEQRPCSDAVVGVREQLARRRWRGPLPPGGERAAAGAQARAPGSAQPSAGPSGQAPGGTAHRRCSLCASSDCGLAFLRKS